MPMKKVEGGYTFTSAFVELFLTTTKYATHRAMGMAYLLQFIGKRARTPFEKA